MAIVFPHILPLNSCLVVVVVCVLSQVSQLQEAHLLCHVHFVLSKILFSLVISAAV